MTAGSPAGDLFHQHVLAMDALVTDWHGQRWVDLPGRLHALRRDGVLAIEASRGSA
jgi:tRNA(Ile)-lysidine synthase